MIIQGIFLTLFSILLIPTSIITLVAGYKQRNMLNFNTFLITILICGSILQALVTYGGNSRFAFPFIPIVLLLIGRSFAKLYRIKRNCKSILIR